VNKKGLPVWKLAYSFSVYIILPENTHQYLFAAASLLVKRGGSLSFLTIFTFAVPELLDLI
jgi:hypothetical protein